MPHHLNRLTPNLIVSDVSRSIAFYRDVLGFTLAQTVPDAEPFVFAIVRSGNVQVVMPLETKCYGVTDFAFLDPDGYIITFAQPGT